MKRILPALVLAAVVVGLLPALSGAAPVPTPINASQRFVWQLPLQQGNTVGEVDFVDAQTGWFAGDNGTVLKTADGGGTWVSQGPIVEQGAAMEKTDVYDVCFVDANNGWIAADNMVYRTTNGGINWSSTGAWQYDYSANPMAYKDVDFFDANYGWSIGSAKIFRTTNGGTDWTGPATLPGGETPDIIDAVDNVRAFANAGPGEAGYLRTLDGTTWERRYFTGTAHEDHETDDIAAASGSTVYAATGGDLLKTTNGGSTWTTVTVAPGDYIWEIELLDGDPSGQTVYVHDDNSGLWASSDGGATWEARADVNPEGWDCPEAGTLFAVVAGNPALSTDGGATFNSLVAYQPTTNPFRAIDFTSDATGCAMSTNGIARTSNGGSLWEYSTAVAEGMNITQLSDMDFLESDPNLGWIIASPAAAGLPTVFKTQDGGATWQSQEETRMTTARQVCFSDANNGWAIDDSDQGFWHSGDGGATWARIPRTGAVYREVDFVDANNGWIAFSANPATDSVLHTTDGGSTWTTQTVGHSNGEILDIDFVDANNGYAATNFEDAFYKTTNGGATWTQVEFTPWAETFDIEDIAFSTPLDGWVIGAQRTTMTMSYRHDFAAHTTDGGLTWDFYDDPDSSDGGSTGTNVSINTVETFGDHMWIGGGNGSILKTRTRAVATIRSPASTTLAAYGRSCLVTGTLTSGGNPISGATLEVWTGSATSNMVQSAIVATTNADGVFSFTDIPRSATYYAVRYAGNATIGSSARSNSVRVVPRAYVYKPVAPTTMYRSTAKTIYGYVAPRHTSGTYLVKLKFYRRNSSGSYVYHHSVSAKRVYYSSTTKSKYSVKLKMPHTGKWKVKAVHTDGDHAESNSSYDYFTVR